jgi:hypothetical protein
MIFPSVTATGGPPTEASGDTCSTMVPAAVVDNFPSHPDHIFHILPIQSLEFAINPTSDISGPSFGRTTL